MQLFFNVVCLLFGMDCAAEAFETVTYFSSYTYL